MTDAYGNEQNDPYFYITDEEGNEEKFEVLYEFDQEETGYRYLLLIPADDAEEEEVDVYPVKYRLSDKEPHFETIEDEKEWAMIEEILHTLESLEEEDLED